MKVYAMKKIIMTVCAGLIVFSCTTYDQQTIAADNKTKKNISKKKQVVTSSQHRKGLSNIDHHIQPQQIENMEEFVNSFDHEAKQKSVEMLLQQGAEFCKKNSLDAICNAFTHTKDFINGALYLFLVDTQGVFYAHGDQPNLLWKNMWNKRDMFGSLIVQSMITIAHNGGGWLTYEWDGAVKKSLLQRIDIQGKEFVIGCGYFPHSKESAVIGLVKGAVALCDRYIAEGHEISGAFSDISYPLSNQFIFGDLYLYALDFEGKIVAQGDLPRLIGSQALDYKDDAGVAYNADVIKKLKNKEKGEGIWFDYISKNAPKRAYAEKVVDAKGKEYFIACGYYPSVTRETTMNLVRRGYQFMKGNGLSVAVKEFNDDQEEKFREGDLGIFLYDMNGECIANGRNPILVGQNQFDYKDEDGRYVIRELIKQANAGGGWVNFKKKHSFQATYVEKIDLGVGEYIIGADMFPSSKPDTMQLLVKSAIAFLAGHTFDQLLGRAVDRSDEFLRGDLFMYVFDLEGFCYAWGDNYQLIWQNLIEWKDDNGMPFVRAMIEASSGGPESLVLKMNRCQRVHYFEQVEKEGKKYIVGSGFYK
jgi:signal transduction histidine kinase